MKRQRGRGRKPSNPGNRSLESNGPDVKIRGTAAQIYEKYAQYARDAHTAGDRIKAENYLQHAEHYYRIMAANMPKDRPVGDDQQGHASGNGGRDHGSSRDEGSVDDPLKVMDDDVEQDDDYEADMESDDDGRQVEAEEAPPKKRGRRGPRRKTEGDAPATDREARSALDTLAEQQAAIAGG